MAGSHQGAQWRKCDFQIHTPRDPQWSGSPALPGGTTELEGERAAWADRFVAACTARRLTAFAVTDHHDYALLEHIKAAVSRLDPETRPWFFPGMEVTCTDSAQCLVLFDPETTEQHWRQLFGKFRNVPPPDPNAARAPQAQECGLTVEELIGVLAEDVLLRNRTIMLPHAGGDDAHKSVLRQGFHPRFRALACDGVYIEKPFADLNAVTKQKIYGQIDQWGRRRRGIIATGDNRFADWRRLGAHACWIRLGEPTTEAIRQALLADEARIAYEQPVLPSQRVLGVRVSSQLTGPDFALTLNDGFTTLIGGRGSGKSAVLEYLRFGLGRSAVDIDQLGEAKRRDGAPEVDLRTRERDLITTTLQDGWVEVTLERDGVVEVWRREGRERDTIRVTAEGTAAQVLPVPAAQERFRARAFYQKQLSSLVVNTASAADQITGIAAAESVDLRRSIEQAAVAAKRQVVTAFQELVQHWATVAELTQATEAVEDLRRRIAATQKRLEEEGLSPEGQSLLAQAPTMNRRRALFSEAASRLTADAKTVADVGSRLGALDVGPWEAVAGQADVDAYAAALREARAKVDALLSAAAGAITALEAARARRAGGFATAFADFDARHKQAVAAQASLQVLVTESQKLVDELGVAEARQRAAQAAAAARGDAPERLAAARSRVADIAAEMRRTLEVAAQSVAAMSDGLIRATVVTDPVPAEFVDALHDLCDKVRIRELRMKCEDFVRQQIAAGNWDGLVDALLDIYRHKVQTRAVDPGEDITARIATALSFPGGLTATQTAEIFARFDDTQLSRLLMLAPAHRIAFEYRDGDNFVPFVQASPGQQAAALLTLLLNQEAGTLVIDQPEDDLDNKVVMDIVRLVQRMKRKRQLIFATHNANFVVNGDADKVVALAPGLAGDGQPGHRIAVAVDGAIETEAVRKEITETMEGGRPAFELRGRKYQFR
ncbi:MAG: hypothetical protein RLY86_3272 [Pseudomonadota bacterium]|jgi:hypothetical protein